MNNKKVIILLVYVAFMIINSVVTFSFENQLWKYDKIVHFLEYFGVGFLLINALKIKPLSKTQWVYAVCFLCLFPIFDESLQYYTPKRIPDIYERGLMHCLNYFYSGEYTN